METKTPPALKSRTRETWRGPEACHATHMPLEIATRGERRFSAPSLRVIARGTTRGSCRLQSSRSIASDWPLGGTRVPEHSKGFNRIPSRLFFLKAYVQRSVQVRRRIGAAPREAFDRQSFFSCSPESAHPTCTAAFGRAAWEKSVRWNSGRVELQEKKQNAGPALTAATSAPSPDIQAKQCFASCIMAWRNKRTIRSIR